MCGHVLDFFNDHRSKSHVPIHHIPLIHGNPYYYLRETVVKS